MDRNIIISVIVASSSYSLLAKFPSDVILLSNKLWQIRLSFSPEVIPNYKFLFYGGGPVGRQGAIRIVGTRPEQFLDPLAYEIETSHSFIAFVKIWLVGARENFTFKGFLRH